MFLPAGGQPLGRWAMAVQRRLDAIAATRESGRAPVICLLDQGPPSQVAELGAGRWAGDRSTRCPGAEYATGDVRTQLRRPDDLLLLARPSRRGETFRRRPRSHGSGAVTLSMMLGLILVSFYSIFMTCSSIFPLHISYHPQLGFSLLKASLLPRESVPCALNFAQRSVSPLETTPGGLTTPRRPRITPSEGYQTSAKAIWRCGRYGPPSREQVQRTPPDATSRLQTSRAFRGLSFTVPHGRTRRRRAAPSLRTALIQHDRGAAHPCLFKRLLDCCAGAMATGPEDPSVLGPLVQKYLDQCNNDLSSKCDKYLRQQRGTTLREALANKGANWLEKMIVAMPQGGEAVIAVMLECRAEVPSAYLHVNYLAQAIYRLRMIDVRKIAERVVFHSPRRGPLMRQVHRLALALARKSENGIFELRFAITGEGLRNNESRYHRVVKIEHGFDDCRIFHQFLAVVDSLDLDYEVSWDVLRGSLECLRDVQLTEEALNAHSLKNSPRIVASNAQYGGDMSCLVPIKVFVTMEEVKQGEGWYSDEEEEDEEDGADDLDGPDAWAMGMTDETNENATTRMRNKLFFELSEAATAATGVSLSYRRSLGAFGRFTSRPRRRSV